MFAFHRVPPWLKGFIATIVQEDSRPGSRSIIQVSDDGKEEGSAILNPLTLSLSKVARKITRRATHFVLAFNRFLLRPAFHFTPPKSSKLRAAYPAVAPGSTPSWITAEKKLWQKYGFEVEPILVSGGARAVPALIGQSVSVSLRLGYGVTTPSSRESRSCASA